MDCSFNNQYCCAGTSGKNLLNVTTSQVQSRLVTGRKDMEKIEMEPTQLQREHDCVEHGNLRDSQGLYDKALSAYDVALGIDPEDADALFDKGITLKKLGKNSEGNALVNKAVNLYMAR
jgi:tetratricopeptide (TPR) repeat protein